MFFDTPTETERLKRLMEEQARKLPSPKKIIQLEVDNWLSSSRRNLMLTGKRYYLNHTDIEKKEIDVKAQAAGHSNNKLDYAFIRKLVDQKIGYLLSKTPTFQTDNEIYQDLLNEKFDRSFLRALKNVGKEAINKGIGWLQVYFDETGELRFKKHNSEEIIPLWSDSSHTMLDAVIRVYNVSMYTENGKADVRKIEYWTNKGVEYYEYNSTVASQMGYETALYSDYSDFTRGASASHFELIQGDEITPYNFDRPPFIAIKYNDEEQPLIDIIKSIVDNYNYQASINADLLADIPKFIYILTNYGGADLDEFLSELRDFRVIKLDDDGSLDKLSAEPNTQAVESLLSQERRNIYEFGRGVSAEHIQSGGNSTNLQIKALFADLDMDMNIFETEIQAAFENIIYFVNAYLDLLGKGDFTNDNVNVILNRDIIMSETETINNLSASEGMLSQKTIVSQHPYVDDPKEELKRIEQEQEDQLKKMEEYDNNFGDANER